LDKQKYSAVGVEYSHICQTQSTTITLTRILAFNLLTFWSFWSWRL